MWRWKHSLSILSLLSAKERGRACPSGSLGACKRRKSSWSKKQRSQSKQQWNISSPCLKKKHIQATQLVRLEFSHRSYIQPFPKRLWIWFKLELQTQQKLKHSLKYYVDNILSKEVGKKPVAGDRAFYPLNEDIRNHVSKAKRALELSKYDQENVRLKIEEWKKDAPQSSFFFRPFRSTPWTEHSTDDIKARGEWVSEETLLYIQQEEWQKELLTCYGNTVTLMDATYKTTKYSIPLFPVCVKTNVSYSIVAEFIIQSETTECIYEALSILKSWNPEWEPQFYLKDYSGAEIAAVNKLFPRTQVYLCEFHREQAWERWVKERKHGLSDNQAAARLDLLRDCANALPNHNLPDEPTDHYYCCMNALPSSAACSSLFLAMTSSSL